MSASLPQCLQWAVPLIFLGSVDGDLSSDFLGAGSAGASGSEHVISISASFPQFSHLQTCFLTMFDICFPFLNDGFEHIHE
jgi:hypothetical protein